MEHQIWRYKPLELTGNGMFMSNNNWLRTSDCTSFVKRPGIYTEFRHFEAWFWSVTIHGTELLKGLNENYFKEIWGQRSLHESSCGWTEH